MHNFETKRGLKVLKMMNSDSQEENLNYSAVVQSDKENDNIEEEHDLNEEDYENANSTPMENDLEAIKEVDDFEKENSDSVDNLPMGGDIAKSRSRFQNAKLQQEKKGVETNPALQRRRSSQVEDQFQIILSSSELSFGHPIFSSAYVEPCFAGHI